MIYRVLAIASFLLISFSVTGQKSRVLSVLQLIESGKYEDARDAIELAAWNDKTSRWPRTYYAKGLLCQTAFEDGFENNDTKKTRIYPDQLFVAYDAYEKALRLDTRERLHSLLAQQYYALSNDFQKLGKKQYQARNYEKATESFEHALLVSKSPLLTVETDTNLVYNIALAAFESQKWDKAISYLTGLDEDGYSPNTAQLLYSAHVNNNDSALAEQVLIEGMERYDNNEAIVLQLVDLFVTTGRIENAIAILDSAVSSHPLDYMFYWTRGMVYQKMDQYNNAIEDFLRASDLAPAETGIYYNLGISYYNIGVEINEDARHISNNSEYQAARGKVEASFYESVKWLEKAFESDPGDRQTITRLHQLYQRLQMTDKKRTMELLLE